MRVLLVVNIHYLARHTVKVFIVSTQNKTTRHVLSTYHEILSFVERPCAVKVKICAYKCTRLNELVQNTYFSTTLPSGLSGFIVHVC